MRSYGTFDDRNEARLRVKHWLSANDPEAYSPQNIRHLVAATVRSDTDPVDGIHDSWREASYGAMLGIGDFIGEALSQMAQGHEDGPLRATLDAANRAVSCLPHDPSGTLAHLDAARRCLGDAHNTSLAGDSAQTARAARALGLAQDLLRQ